mmetsp:Transcript_60117/g.159939  ORF Transcript_60117/g.159939 Transcript_60117/m.159939 type:complete len:390 (+) Transcript_60117:86-1255(+)
MEQRKGNEATASSSSRCKKGDWGPKKLNSGTRRHSTARPSLQILRNGTAPQKTDRSKKSSQRELALDRSLQCKNVQAATIGFATAIGGMGTLLRSAPHVFSIGEIGLQIAKQLHSGWGRVRHCLSSGATSEGGGHELGVHLPPTRVHWARSLIQTVLLIAITACTAQVQRSMRSLRYERVQHLGVLRLLCDRFFRSRSTMRGSWSAKECAELLEVYHSITVSIQVWDFEFAAQHQRSQLFEERCHSFGGKLTLASKVKSFEFMPQHLVEVVTQRGQARSSKLKILARAISVIIQRHSRFLCRALVDTEVLQGGDEFRLAQSAASVRVKGRKNGSETAGSVLFGSELQADGALHVAPFRPETGRLADFANVFERRCKLCTGVEQGVFQAN